MAGYSGKPLWQKLGFRENMKVVALGSPPAYQEMLGDAPSLRIVRSASKAAQPYEAVHLFCTRQAELEKHLVNLRSKIAQDGMVWVSWPKKSSGVASDLSDNSVRAAALPLGFVDNKVCAVDDTWSGLKLVIRVSERN